VDDRDLSIAALFGALAGGLGYVLGKWHKKTSFEVTGTEDRELSYDFLTDTWKPLTVALPESFGVPYESKPIPTPKTLPPPLQPWLPPPTKPQPVAVPDPKNIVPEPELPDSLIESLPEAEIDVERFRRMS
jgi:hypothetical protein